MSHMPKPKNFWQGERSCDVYHVKTSMLSKNLIPFQIHTSESEKKLGFLLKPASHSVKVVDKPVLGLTFEQYRATVTGKLHCLGKDENIRDNVFIYKAVT